MLGACFVADGAPFGVLLVVNFSPFLGVHDGGECFFAMGTALLCHGVCVAQSKKRAFF